MNTTPYKIAYGDTLGAIASKNGLSVQDIVAANPTIKDPNRISAGASLVIPTKAPVVAAPVVETPTTSPTGGKTIASAAKDIVPDFQYINDTDPAINAYVDSLKTSASSTIDEAEIRRQTRERIQAQIDSLKVAGAQSLARAREAGAGRLGTSTAINARSGNLGSSFAQADENNIKTYNQGIETDIEAETQAKVVGLLNQADKDASQDIADRRAAKEKGAEEYVKFITTRNTARSTKASALAKAFAAQGIDPTKLSANDAKKLQDAYGVDSATFNGMVSDAKLAEDKAKAETEKIARTSQPQSVQEYEYAKESGYTGTYNEYQNLDANRKAQIARAGVAKNEFGLTPSQQFTASQTLQKKVANNTDAAREINRQIGVMTGAWDRYATGKATDLNATSQAIITAFNKVLDPTSVVRETEYDRSGSGQALLSKIEGKIATINQGGPGLTKESLQELVNLGKTYEANAKRSIEAEQKRAREEAQYYGLNADFVSAPAPVNESAPGTDGGSTYTAPATPAGKKAIGTINFFE